MRKPKETTTVRVEDRPYAFLRAFAMQEGKSIAGALDWLIADAERRVPVQLTIRHVLTPSGDFYAVCVGSGEAIWEGATLAEAKSALADIRATNGFDAKRFPLSPKVIVEDLRDPPLAGLSEFNTA